MTLRGRTRRRYAAVLDPAGERLATAHRDGYAFLWDAVVAEGLAASARRLRCLRGHGGAVVACGWSADGRRVATASKDRTARVWGAKTGNELATLAHPCRCAAVALRGYAVATAAFDGIVRLWNVAPEKEKDAVRVDFSPEEESAWSSHLAAARPGHRGRATSLAFDAAGKTLVSAGFDRAAIGWDADSCLALGLADDDDRTVAATVATG